MKPTGVPLPKPCLCPACGTLLEASSSLVEDSEARPEPGDCTMCLGCGTILIYTPDMLVRVASPSDLAEMHPDMITMLFAAQMAQRVTRILHPPKPEGKH
jgi:hypothetical protein